MRHLNPIVPVPILIILLFIAIVLLIVAWIVNKENRLKSSFKLLLRLIIVALALIIALRPMTEERGGDIQLSNLDVLFVLDTTLSMWANDAPNYTRFQTAQNDIEVIMDGLSGANFGLITFQDKSVVLSPFTQDKETVLSLLNSIQTPYQDGVSNGSRMDTSYYDLENLLISSSRKENRRTIVFFLSDGEVTHPSDTPVDYEVLSNFVDGGAVIGYGTKEGGKMKDGWGNTVRDSDMLREAVSSIDEESLKNIADALGIEYIHREYNTLLTPLITRIKATGSTVTERRNDIVNYNDTYYRYVPFLMILLLLDLIIRIRENARVREKHGKKSGKK